MTDIPELIRTRRSVRTFDGRKITVADRDRLNAFARSVDNPYGIPVSIVLLDKDEYGLSSLVLDGETLYAAGKAPITEHSEEAFGYSFEQFVLKAWSLGIGTTWIAGTMNREHFETAAGRRNDERMYCITPLGYPAKKMSLRETLMRKGVKADKRKPQSELFFDGDFNTPLITGDKRINEALEAVRLAPSAVNLQPWRIVRTDNQYHFYVKHKKGYIGEDTGDLQKVDMGIALCHFMEITKGELIINDPGIQTEEDMEYISTVEV